MTLAGDFGTNVGAEGGSSKSQTNLFIGIGIGVVGVLAAGAIAYTQVLPALQQNQTLQTEVNDKGGQVKQAAELERLLKEAQDGKALAEQQKEEVTSLFADEAALQTLLLDINRILKERGVKLNRFQPDPEGIELITDGSLGTEVDGKLRSRGYQLEFSGTFDQTRLVLLNLERLQPLLVVDSMRVEVNPSSQQVLWQGGSLVSENAPELTTQMEIKALLPAKLAPPPPPPPPAEAPPAEAPPAEAPPGG